MSACANPRCKIAQITDSKVRCLKKERKSMKKKSSSRVLSLLLTLAMLTGGVAPISAAGNISSSEKLKTEKVDADIASRLAFEDVSPAESEVQYADGDIVRVSVVLEKSPHSKSSRLRMLSQVIPLWLTVSSLTTSRRV